MVCGLLDPERYICNTINKPNHPITYIHTVQVLYNYIIYVFFPCPSSTQVPTSPPTRPPQGRTVCNTYHPLVNCITMTELYHTLHYTTTLRHAFVAVHNGTILHTQIRVGLCHARFSCVNCYMLFPYSFSTMGQPMSTRLLFRTARWVLHILPSYTICEHVTHIPSVSSFLNTCGVAYFLPCESGTNTQQQHYCQMPPHKTLNSANDYFPLPPHYNTCG